MGGYSRTEAATRSGVERAYVDRLIEFGILSPDADDRLSVGDVRRIQMVLTLQDAGISLETVVAGMKSGLGDLSFMDAPVYRRFATFSDDTFQSLSERTGLPLNLLLIIREAAGGAVASPDDLVREDELAVVPLIETGLAAGIRPLSLERSLRVMGDGLRRLAATESDAWWSDVASPLMASRPAAPALAQNASSAETQALIEATDAAVLAIWHAQQAQSFSSNIIGGFERSLTDAGIFEPAERPPAICFLDVTGYTRLTNERGDAAAADLAEGLGRLVGRIGAEHGGRPVKWLGDGVMLYFRDPALGVMAALEMVDGVRDASLPPAHVGIHAGPVLFQQGDYFGQTVNLAARIADYARPGEVLVTQEVVDASDGGGVAFTEIGPVELKGISGAVRLHGARRASTP